MHDDRRGIGSGGIVRILLLLVVVWLALEVFGEVLGLLGSPFGLLRPLIGLVVLVIIILFLLGRL